MRFCIAIAGLCVALLPAASHSETPQQIAGIYSDLAYNQESGDLNGTEIFIVTGAGATHHVAFVQQSDSVPLDPVIAPVLEKGGRISIHARFADYTLQFDGRIDKTGFNGTVVTELPGGKKLSQPFHLRRKKSYWE